VTKVEELSKTLVSFLATHHCRYLLSVNVERSREYPRQYS